MHSNIGRILSSSQALIYHYHQLDAGAKLVQKAQQGSDEFLCYISNSSTEKIKNSSILI